MSCIFHCHESLERADKDAEEAAIAHHKGSPTQLAVLASGGTVCVAPERQDGFARLVLNHNLVTTTRAKGTARTAERSKLGHVKAGANQKAGSGLALALSCGAIVDIPANLQTRAKRGCGAAS